MSAPDTTTTAGLPIRLDGQVALVTGGGRGLGRSIAQGLAAAGAATAVLARSAAELDETVMLIEAAGGRAIAVPGDVTNWRALESAVASIERQLGSINLLASIAGIYGVAGPTWESDPDDWWAVVDANLRGRYLSARAVLPGMVARRRGRIINMGSMGGLIAGPYTTAYSSTYAGVLRFSESLAAEVKDYGVSVFTISPGFTVTAGAERTFPSWQPWVPGIARMIAAGYSSPPEATPELVTWIASGQADALSGRYLSITDDYRAMAEQSETIQAQDLYVLRLRTDTVS